jgi:hypothetical protein
MNIRVVVIFLLTLVILAGARTSLAKPEYLTSLNTVYGNGLCDTCHVNGNKDGPRTSYGTLFESQPNHAADPGAALSSIGAPPTANPTLTPIATLTPAATATTAISATVTPVASPTPAVTTVSTTATPAAPGFGIVASLVGLFAWFLMIKRK